MLSYRSDSVTRDKRKTLAFKTERALHRAGRGFQFLGLDGPKSPGRDAGRGQCVCTSFESWTNRSPQYVPFPTSFSVISFPIS